MFSKALFKQSCKANGVMWSIITAAVCFMLACVMLISGSGNISDIKNSVEDTIIVETIDSNMDKQALTFYERANQGTKLFDNSFVLEYKNEFLANKEKADEYSQKVDAWLVTMPVQTNYTNMQEYLLAMQNWQQNVPAYEENSVEMYYIGLVSQWLEQAPKSSDFESTEAYQQALAAWNNNKPTSLYATYAMVAKEKISEVYLAAVKDVQDQALVEAKKLDEKNDENSSAYKEIMGSMLFAINPGSTSTKIAMFEGEKEIFSRNISHDAEKLKEFKEISDQLPYRKEMILNVLKEEGQTLEGVDAFSARGGGLVNVEGGVFTIGDKLLEHARTCYTVKHPATLGAQLADAFSKEFGGAAFVVNPPDVDEFQDVARVTGLKGVYRESRIHALNQKEIGIRFAAKQGKKYEDMNLIICHIGGGISVTAHRMGKMVDSNDIANGDGPMAPTRCGQLPVKDVVTMCYSGKYTEKEMREKITKTGGLVDHLGTSDAREVTAMIENGNKYAKLIYDSMIYEIGKTAGSMAAVLHGKVDGIVLTGGISHDKYVVEKLTEMLSFIAPITVMAGEFEMEALAAGAIRVLSGEEEAKTYTGIPVWSGFTC